MGLLTWTKTWSSADNGTILTGTHLGTIQTDIAAIINGGITNANVGASAAIEESKLAFDTIAGHDHNGTNSKVISGSFLHYITGAQLVFVSVATVKATPGALDINGNIYTRTEFSSTLNLATAGDWLYGSEPADGWVYIYAYNDTGSSWDIKLSTQAPAYSNCGTSTDGALRYRQYADVWYRCIGAVRNSSSDILKFYQIKDWVYYDVFQRELNNGTAGTWTDVDCTSSIPAFSTLMIYRGYNAGGGSDTYDIRPKGGAAPGTPEYISFEAQGTYSQLQLLDSAQVIQYKGYAATTLDIDVIGYYTGGIR